MLNFGASKPRVKGGPGTQAPLDPHLSVCVDDWTARSAIIASNGNGHRGRSSQSMISKY